MNLFIVIIITFSSGGYSSLHLNWISISCSTTPMPLVCSQPLRAFSCLPWVHRCHCQFATKHAVDPCLRSQGSYSVPTVFTRLMCSTASPGCMWQSKEMSHKTPWGTLSFDACKLTCHSAHCTLNKNIGSSSNFLFHHPCSTSITPKPLVTPGVF